MGQRDEEDRMRKTGLFSRRFRVKFWVGNYAQEAGEWGATCGACIDRHTCSSASKARHEVPGGSDGAWAKRIEKGQYPYLLKSGYLTAQVLKAKRGTDSQPFSMRLDSDILTVR
jgi:hypothetical protein